MTTQTLIELRKLVDIFGQEAENDGYKDRLISKNTYEAKTMLLDALEAQAAEIEALKHPKEKIAPVQGWPQGIPWSLHLEAYGVYCKKWGAQQALIDLEGRNCRGGFGVDELDDFIPGWRDRVSELTAVKKERDALRAELAALKAQEPVREPLTLEKIADLNCVSIDRLDYDVFELDQESVIDFARAVEAAHGITQGEKV
jgi:hypothetical protein